MIYIDMPFSVYSAIDALNNSGMSALARSPAHYQAGLDSTNDTKLMLFGRAVHCAILEPIEFGSRYVGFYGDRRTKDGKAAYEALADSGREILSGDDFKQVLEIRNAVSNHTVASGIIANSSHEVTTLWTDESGAACKARADIIMPDGFVWDLKTTDNAADFAYSIRKYNYDRQAAFYLDGFNAPGFGWIVVEKSSPYGVRVIRASDATIVAGREKYKPLAALYAECVLIGEWNGYNTTIEEI